MKKSREVLEKALTDICLHIAVDSESCNKIYDCAKNNYNIPRGITSDIICLRLSINEVNDFVLFCILNSIVKVLGDVIKISDYYTKQEINHYSKSKYQVDQIEFPLRLKMIQISNDQWIGSISNQMLMKFRAAQLINYNVNSQRTLTKVVSGDKEIYKITLNQKAVSEIKDSLEKRLFVPNTLTFNIPEDIESDFYYNNESMELVIKKIKHIDIIDGFHRYIAACRQSDEDQDFQFNWEMRIVNFSEDKAKNFIYQEDLKTRMKKIDSNSMNMNDAANIVVTKLNENSRCNLKGLISRNEGLINFGEMSELIRYFFFKNVTKKESGNLLIISIVKYLCECFNTLTEYNTNYIEHKYTYKQLFIVIYVFYLYRNKDHDKMCEVIDIMMLRQDMLDAKKFHTKIPRRSMVNEIEKLYEVVISDV